MHLICVTAPIDIPLCVVSIRFGNSHNESGELRRDANNKIVGSIQDTWNVLRLMAAPTDGLSGRKGWASRFISDHLYTIE